MNRTSLGLMNGPMALAATMTLAGLCTAAAPAADDRDSAGAVARAEVMVIGEDDHDARTIQIMIEDGELSVKVDGREVPDDRIRREGGRIIILDEDGNEIETMIMGGVEGHGGEHRWLWTLDEDDLHFSPDEGLRFAPMPVHENHPPVMLGIGMGVPGPALQVHLGLDPDATTMVSGVYEDLPAHRAGIREFDSIVQIDGRTPANPDAIGKALMELEEGDEVELTVIQKGKRRRVVVELDEWDRERMTEAKLLGSGGAGSLRWRGMEVQPGPGGGEILVAPKGGGIFEFRNLVPHMEDLEGMVRQRLEDAMRHRGDLTEEDEDRLDGRFERLQDRMVDLERILERFLEEIEERHEGEE
jgi:hypothetical protein